MDPFEEAQQKFRAGLSAQDKLLFTQSATPNEVLSTVQSLEQRHRDQSRTLKLVQKVDPFIKGIQQYGNALNQFANIKPEILGLIWGSACIIIRLLRDFLDLFDKLTDMLHRLARQLGLFEVYARLYPHSTRLKGSLVEGYNAYLEFCLSAVKMLQDGPSRKNQWLKNASLKLLTKALFKPVKQEFERVTSRLESLVDSIETEANAAEKEAATDHREVVNEHIDFKKYQDLLKWLDPVDAAAVLLDLSDIHLPGTGQWLIGNTAYIKWFTNQASVVWLHAKPGADIDQNRYNLIKHLQQHANDKSLVLYYFCDYKSAKSQQTRTVLQTLLADLGRQNNQALDILEARTRRYRQENSICSLKTLVEILIESLALYSKVHVVIDALDESSNRPELIQLLVSLQSKSPTTSLFLTSRDEFDIRNLLGHVEQISVGNSDVTSDIDHFINHTVTELLNNGRLKLRDKTLKETITQKLRDKADGMFQYVKCQLDTLSQCISDKSIIKMLENLPSSLDQTYVRALEGLKTRFPDMIDLINWIFCCIVHSMRPLSLAELSELVAFDVREGLFDFSAVPTDPHDLLRYSGGLFRFSEAKETLSLVHFSVKEFLEDERICKTPVRDFYMGDDTVHLHIFRACLSYLLLPDFSRGECATKRQLQLRIQRFVLFNYASCNWMKHYCRVFHDIGKDWERRVISFLCHNDFKGNLVAWRQGRLMAESSISWFKTLTSLNPLTLPENPISYATEDCCWPLTQLLVREGFDVNKCGGTEIPPVLNAVTGRQRQVDWNYIRKLLQAGADPHVTSWRGNLAFGIAIFGGPDDWNLLKDLPFSAADFEDRHANPTILQYFARHPSDPAEWLAYVLGLGVDVNEEDLWTVDGCNTGIGSGSDGPPLQLACFYGLERCARLLLNSGADINYAICALGTPLQAAIGSNNHVIVKLLLDQHVEVNKEGGSLGTPLQAAAWQGNEDLVLMLLNNGANVNSTVGVFGSPLAAAIAKQSSGIIDLLLDRGADPGSIAKLRLPKMDLSFQYRYNELPTGAAIGSELRCRTPLTWAIVQEDKETVQKLLLKGAAVNFPPERGQICLDKRRIRTTLDHPLCMAIKVGNAEIVELIRQSSANTWIGAGCPLLTCIECGNREIFHTLWQADAGSADANDILLEALCKCNDDELSLELIKIIDAQPVAADPKAVNSLWFNSTTSSVKAKWLLSRGSIPKVWDWHHEWLDGTLELCRTETHPLISAIQHQDYGLVDILLQAGLDVNEYAGDGPTPLLAAVKCGDHALMKRLLDLGASPTINAFKHGSCNNVIHQARGTEAIDILLNYGAKIDDTCDYCPTALWRSVMKENCDRILHLASRGANVDWLNFEGESPLQYAQRFHLDDIAELLGSLGGRKAGGKAQRATQISSVLSIASQFKFISPEEPSWLSERRWVMLGKCLFLLEDYENSIIALEMTVGEEGPYCGGRGSHSRRKSFHFCHKTGFEARRSCCLTKDEREVNRVGSTKDHVYVTFPRPFLEDCPDGFVALDETTHITRNEWLDRVLAKWQRERDSTSDMCA